jgi:hypothetical protein
MDQRKNQVKYKGYQSANFADEIIFGDRSITSKNFDNNSDIDLFSKPRQKHSNIQESSSQNYLLNFSILSFSLIALMIVFSKIVSTTFISFNSLSTAIFVGGYFSLFLLTIFIISKRKMLTLEIKGEELHLKSFPALNKIIPVSQILKCELNTINNGRFNSINKIHFALNENGNRYKQPLTSGITLQLINGQHIIIASHKS